GLLDPQRLLPDGTGLGGDGGEVTSLDPSVSNRGPATGLDIGPRPTHMPDRHPVAGHDRSLAATVIRIWRFTQLRVRGMQGQSVTQGPSHLPSGPILRKHEGVGPMYTLRYGP